MIIGQLNFSCLLKQPYYVTMAIVVSPRLLPYHIYISCKDCYLLFCNLTKPRTKEQQPHEEAIKLLLTDVHDMSLHKDMQITKSEDSGLTTMV